MQLVADRFMITPHKGAFDLATGEAVVLRVAKGGEGAEQARWALRCDALHGLKHRAIAPLLDYGAVGRSERFEAWHCGSVWTGAPSEADRSLNAASHFFRACGLTAGNAGQIDVHALGGRAVVVPDCQAGYTAEDATPAPIEAARLSGAARLDIGRGLLDARGAPPPLARSTTSRLAPAAGASDPASEADPKGPAPLDICGLRRISRPTDRALTEVFESPTGPRPSVVQVWGPLGSGRTDTVLEAARVARQRGFIPITVKVLNLLDLRLVQHRSLCLIDDDTDEARWRALVTAVLGSPRPHVLLVTSQEETRGVHSIGLDRVSPEVFIGAVRPQSVSRVASERVARAARMAQGLPGKFAELVWGQSAVGVEQRSPRRSASSRVAEQRAVYGAPLHEVQDAREALVEHNTGGAWPAPGELMTLRRRMAAAKQLVAQGRHAPGLRQLRQALGALARRDDWAHAAEGAFALAAALLGRGRPREAQETLDEARRFVGKGGDERVLVDFAVLTAHAWIDLARLDEAESVGGAALAAARALDDVPRVAAASLALGRCLFWRGRYGEADAALSSLAGMLLPPRTLVQREAAAARVAVGLGDLPRAGSLAREAAEGAGRLEDPALVAAAACAAAFVHLGVNDLDMVRQDVRRSIAAARQARLPLRAIRARLILAEAERRGGQGQAAAALIAHMRRLDPSCLPAIVRARCDLIAEAASGAASNDISVRHRARTGLEALGLYVAGPTTATGSPRLDPLGEAVVNVLRICQSAEEDTHLLTEVCASLRRELRAASVAMVGVENATCRVLTSDGARVDTGLAERVVASGLTIAPHLCDGRVEAGAPVRYGGGIKGALVARWPLGTPYDLSRAATLLAAAATAGAPAVAAALLRRTHPADPAVGDLLGVSTAMADLRQAVQAAAQAPFAVLVEGESGSGKELVARAVHRAGPRRDRPFCTLNCAALPDELVEAELFGHARGAFTGAVGERAGVFEEAHGGTLFLDEVGELSPRAQAKLLRVIQEGELRRIGENQSRRVDVRIVAATNRDLRAEVAAGRFRLDLLYRLDVVPIAVPPLRQRREDIPVLADHFWREATSRIGSRASLAAMTVAALARYDWPGNVRELQNVLAALAVRSPRRGVIPVTALPPPFGEATAADTWRLDQARRTFEERFVRAALARSGGRRVRAAAELGVTRQGLTKLMGRLGIKEVIKEGPKGGAEGLFSHEGAKKHPEPARGIEVCSQNQPKIAGASLAHKKQEAELPSER